MMPAAMIYKTASLSVKSVPGITGKFSPFEIKDVTVDPIYINTSKEANIRDSLENISEFAPLTKTTPDYTVLYGDEWTRQNTLKDIRYFARKLKTLTPSEPLYARIQAESGATIPPILQTAFAEKLCNGIGGSGTPRTLWYSLLSYETEYCRESSLFAFLDYQNVGDTNGNLFTQNARILTDNSSS